MHKLVLVILLLTSISLAAAGCQEIPTYSLTGNKDLVYVSGQKRGQQVEWKLDVYAPDEPGNWPIVLYLHGFGETKDTANQLPHSIAEQGALVFSIDYPHVDPTVAMRDNGRRHRELDEIVACAIRFARAAAADLGSDNTPLAVVGTDYGGGVGSHVALMGENVDRIWEEYAESNEGPPPQCDCTVSQGSTAVDALVGIAGEYDAFIGYDGRYGREFMQEQNPNLWQMLHSSIGENPDLKVRLLHAKSDSTVPYENSAAFETVLAEAGYDVELIPINGDNSTPTAPIVETVMKVLGD